jgi:hypothetical protein
MAEIYAAIKKTMEDLNTDHCQSWWLNPRNYDLKSKLPTRIINQRAKMLVKQGYLTIDSRFTSVSTGTSYKLTSKMFINPNLKN